MTRFSTLLSLLLGEFCTSYMELPFLFHSRGYILEAFPWDNITFRDLSFWMRRMFVYIGRMPDHDQECLVRLVKTNAQVGSGRTLRFPRSGRFFTTLELTKGRVQSLFRPGRSH